MAAKIISFPAAHVFRSVETVSNLKLADGIEAAGFEHPETRDLGACAERSLWMAKAADLRGSSFSGAAA